MTFPEVLKQPSTFVAAALVAACVLALAAAIGGFLLIQGATQTALTVRPVVEIGAAEGSAPQIMPVLAQQ